MMTNQLSLEGLFESDHARSEFHKQWKRNYLHWPHRTLEGVEKEQMLTILKLKDPEEIDTGSQRFVTVRYSHNGKRYDLTEFDETEYE